jgi:hypothetical protein
MLYNAVLENPNYTVDPRNDCREFDLLTVYFIDRGGLRLFDGADSSNVLANKQCYTMLFSNSFVTSIDAQWISLGKYILGIRVCVCVCLFVLYPGVHKKMVSTDDDTSFIHVSATEDPETDISCTDVMILLLCLSSIGGFIVFLVWIASPRLFGTPPS